VNGDKKIMFKIPKESIASTSSNENLKKRTAFKDQRKQTFFHRLFAELSNSAVFEIYSKRVVVLITLLLFQSVSSSILQRYEDLISNHQAVTLFLTMLVGAGGNCGNQATVSAITKLATKEYTLKSFFSTFRREFSIAILLSITLFFVGFIRVGLFYPGDEIEDSHLRVTFAISLSLFSIVLLSVLVGTCLPFLFVFIRMDPSHAGPVIQVVMDIIGVFLTCFLCNLLLVWNKYQNKAKHYIFIFFVCENIGKFGECCQIK